MSYSTNKITHSLFDMDIYIDVTTRTRICTPENAMQAKPLSLCAHLRRTPLNTQHTPNTIFFSLSLIDHISPMHVSSTTDCMQRQSQTPACKMLTHTCTTHSEPLNIQSSLVPQLSSESFLPQCLMCFSVGMCIW